jgi:hypothetical protein
MASGQSEWWRSTIILRPNFHMESALLAAEGSTPKLFPEGKDNLPAESLNFLMRRSCCSVFNLLPQIVDSVRIQKRGLARWKQRS